MIEGSGPLDKLANTLARVAAVLGILLIFGLGYWLLA